MITQDHEARIISLEETEGGGGCCNGSGIVPLQFILLLMYPNAI